MQSSKPTVRRLGGDHDASRSTRLAKGRSCFGSQQAIFVLASARSVGQGQVEEVRENVTRPEVPDVIVRVFGLKNPVWCSAFELRRPAQEAK